jgi:hypothetical protein
VREPFAHEAVIGMAPGGDDRAPAAAITIVLCGSLDHEPPCPLAPHHTATRRVDGELHLRTLFVVEPEREDEVRERIAGALRTGRLAEGGASPWELRSTDPSPVRAAEADHARRLAAS